MDHWLSRLVGKEVSLRLADRDVEGVVVAADPGLCLLRTKKSGVRFVRGVKCLWFDRSFLPDLGAMFCLKRSGQWLSSLKGRRVRVEARSWVHEGEVFGATSTCLLLGDLGKVTVVPIDEVQWVSVEGRERVEVKIEEVVEAPIKQKKTDAERLREVYGVTGVEDGWRCFSRVEPW